MLRVLTKNKNEKQKQKGKRWLLGGWADLCDYAALRRCFHGYPPFITNKCNWIDFLLFAFPTTQIHTHSAEIRFATKYENNNPLISFLFILIPLLCVCMCASFASRRFAGANLFVHSRRKHNLIAAALKCKAVACVFNVLLLLLYNIIIFFHAKIAYFRCLWWGSGVLHILWCFCIFVMLRRRTQNSW